MRLSKKITILTATNLILISTNASSDVSTALEKSALQRYTVTQGERTITRGCAKLNCTFSKLGTRWAFLNRYEKYDSLIWKSPPLQINGCEEGNIVEGENGNPSLILSYCNDGQDNIFSILNNRAVISLHSPTTVAKATTKKDSPIEITIHANDSELYPRALEEETIQRWPEILGTKTLDQFEQTASPSRFKFIQIRPPTLKEFEQAHAIAKKIWIGNHKNPEKKAKEIVKYLEPMLIRLDWRELPNSELARLNDIGFWLQQTNQCTDAIDAIAILQDVVRRAPRRTPALLNLADTQARILEDECKKYRTFPATTKIAMQENLRAYCQSYGAELIPTNISVRIRRLLDVDELSEETCRSRGEIFEAIKMEDLELLTKILDEHPDDIEEPSPLHKGTLPLFVAVSQRWLAGVEALLQAGADPNRARPSEKSRIYDTTPLQRSVYDGSVEIVKTLLKHNASPDQLYNNSKPLVAAAALRGTHQSLAQPSIEIIKILINSGANINQQDSNGQTALMAAVQDGNLANVDLLLAHGAEVNLLDVAGRNALSQVRLLGTDHDLIWSRIIQNGGNVNQQDRYGRAPLIHILSWRSGHPSAISSMVEFALKHHADPNLRNFEDKQVALHLAAKDGNLPAVNSLIQAGANRCPLDRSGQSPSDLAADSLNDLASKPGCKESVHCSDIAVFQEIIRILDCKSSNGAVNRK